MTIEAKLESWQPASLPAGFSGRVLREKNRRRRRLVVVRGAFVLMMLASLVMGYFGLRLEEASLIAQNERVETDIFDKASVVLEEGGRLAWQGRRWGAIAVEQKSGSVFYRVKTGADFKVKTAVGTIKVRGTCFRVGANAMENDGKKNTTKLAKKRYGAVKAAGTALLGAAFGAGVTLTVYEGNVEVDYDGESLSFGAGQAAFLPSDKATGVVRFESPPSGDDRALDDLAQAQVRSGRVLLSDATEVAKLSRDDLEERYENARYEIARLKKLSQKANKDRKHKTFPVNESELLEMAERCAVREDGPMRFDEEFKLGKGQVKKMQLREGEIAIVEQAVIDEMKQVRSIANDVYQELYGASGENLSYNAIYSEIMHAGNMNSHLMQVMSAERAGLRSVKPQNDWTPAERALRIRIDSGNKIHERVAQALGAKRAAEIRAMDNGWPWGRGEWSGCPDPDK